MGMRLKNKPGSQKKAAQKKRKREERKGVIAKRDFPPEIRPAEPIGMMCETRFEVKLSVLLNSGLVTDLMEALKLSLENKSLLAAKVAVELFRKLESLVGPKMAAEIVVRKLPDCLPDLKKMESELTI